LETVNLRSVLLARYERSSTYLFVDETDDHAADATVRGDRVAGNESERFLGLERLQSRLDGGDDWSFDARCPIDI
jgi:hypothetical protein